MNLHKFRLVFKMGWLFTGDPTDKAAITLYESKSAKVLTSSEAVESAKDSRRSTYHQLPYLDGGALLL
jgi:hypothetical protein